jgi:hypothetical protein
MHYRYSAAKPTYCHSETLTWKHCSLLLAYESEIEGFVGWTVLPFQSFLLVLMALEAYQQLLSFVLAQKIKGRMVKWVIRSAAILYEMTFIKVFRF